MIAKIGRMCLVLAACLFLAGNVNAEGDWTVTSPAGTLTVSVTHSGLDSGQAGLQYEVKLNGEAVLPPAPMGMMMAGDNDNFTSGLIFVATSGVAIIGDDLGDIVESVLVDNLNPPCELTDTDWITPGRVTFPGWSDAKVSKKFDRLKEFVDFAAEVGWEWIEFDTALMDDKLTGTDTWMKTT